MSQIHFQNLEKQLEKMIKCPLETLPHITELEFFGSPVPITGMYMVTNSEGASFLPSDENYTMLSTVYEEPTKYHSMAIAMRNTKTVTGGSDVFITHAIYIKDESGRVSKEHPIFSWTPIGEKVEVVPNLDTNSDIKALSASMGVKIKDYLSQIGTFDTNGVFTPNLINWQNLEQELVDAIKKSSLPTIAISENDFYSTANPPKTGMFIVTPSEGGTELPSRDTFAFVSIYNPEIIQYDNNGTIEEYKVRVVHAMRMTGLDHTIDGMEWFDYTLYRPSDAGWNIPEEETNRDIYSRIGYVADWVPVDTKVVDNLTTGGIHDALSAEQGKVLNQTIGELQTVLNSHINNSQIHMTNTEKSKLGNIEDNANKTNIVNNLTTINTGSALDASQGRALKQMIDSVNSPDKYVEKYTPPNFTLYFDTVNGDDNNLGGSYSAPKKSLASFIESLNGKMITKTLSIIVINGYSANFDETISFNNIIGSNILLRIEGTNGGSVIFSNKSLYVNNCTSRISVDGFTTKSSININGSSNIRLSNCHSSESTNYGFYIGKSIVDLWNCSFNNCKYGIYAYDHSRVFAYRPTATYTTPNASIGISTTQGSYLKIVNKNIVGANIQLQTISGGTIQEV